MKKRIIITAVVVLACAAITAAFLIHRGGKQSKWADFISPFAGTIMSYSHDCVLYFDQDTILHIADPETGRDVINCDRPDCTHEKYSVDNPDPSCPAVFWGIQSTGLALEGGDLYYIGNLGNKDTLKTQYLYRMDANGENRRKAATLDNVQNINEVMYHDGYVAGSYFNRCTFDEDGMIVSDDAPEAGVFVVDLRTDKVQYSEKINRGQANATYLSWYDGKVYYLDMQMKQGTGETASDEDGLSDGNMEYTFCSFDPATGKTKREKTLDGVDVSAVLGHYGYYSTGKGCYELDIDTGKSSLLMKNDDNTDETVFRGKYYGFTGSHEDLYFNSFDDGVIIYYHRNGDSMKKVTSDREHRNWNIVYAAGDRIYFENYDNLISVGYADTGDMDSGSVKIRELLSMDSNGEDQ